MLEECKNLPIECWRHDGKLGKSEACFCLAALPENAIQLKDVFDAILNCPPPVKRTLTLNPGLTNGIAKIIVRYVEPSAELARFYFTEKDGVLNIEFTTNSSQDFCDALAAWCDGGEDFGLAAGQTIKKAPLKDRESGELWFWSEMRP